MSAGKLIGSGWAEVGLQLLVFWCFPPQKQLPNIPLVAKSFSPISCNRWKS